MTLVTCGTKLSLQYADLRFRTESTSPRDICVWAKFDARFCSEPSAQADMVDLVQMKTAYDTSDSSTNVSTTATTTDTTTDNSPAPHADRTAVQQRRLLRSSLPVVDSSNKNNSSTGESPSSSSQSQLSYTKELTWSMLEQEDVFLANEVSERA